MGQKNQIPAKVLNSFNQKFAHVENPKWTKDGATKAWSVHFYENSVEKQANFNAKGAWQYTSTFILDSELPEQVMDEINYNYLNDMILFSEYRITSKGEKWYVIKLKPGMDIDGDNLPEEKLASLYLLIFAPDGQLIAKKDAER